MSLTKETTIIGPLNLIQNERLGDDEKSSYIPCLICEKVYRFPDEKDVYLAHLFMQHRMVIGDVDDIAILDEYLLYWSKKLNDTNLPEFCTTMLLDKRPDGSMSKDEKYFLLSDVIADDYGIRLSLHSKRLDQVLSTHQRERTDKNFKRGCIYCRDVITPTCYDFVEHLYTKHFLQLGKPTNLVYINELIDVIENKIENLICLYCEKTFKDRPTLKEHMRKKGHKQINPDNKNYDKYFLINYKTLKSSITPQPQPNRNMKGKTRVYSRPPNEVATNSNDDSDSDWSDWEGAEQPVTCLFCLRSSIKIEEIKEHMTEDHEFNFDQEVEHLNFYKKIKIVNYLRRQMHVLKCPICDKQFNLSNELQEHLAAAKHCGFGGLSDDSSKKWDQPEYFFPTYEDDAFLCYLDDNLIDGENDTNSESGDAVVIVEECNISANKDAEELSREIRNAN